MVKLEIKLMIKEAKFKNSGLKTIDEMHREVECDSLFNVETERTHILPGSENLEITTMFEYYFSYLMVRINNIIIIILRIKMLKFIEFIVTMVLLFASIVYSTHNIGHNPPYNSGLVEWGKCDDALAPSPCVGSRTDAVIALDSGLNDGCAYYW